MKFNMKDAAIFNMIVLNDVTGLWSAPWWGFRVKPLFRFWALLFVEAYVAYSAIIWQNWCNSSTFKYLIQLNFVCSHLDMK